MQPNTIAYTYDHDNDGGTTAAVAVSLTRFAEELHKSSYITASHNDTVQQDSLNFYRTLPKRSGQFLGTEKTSIKRTKTALVDDAGGLTAKAPKIVETSFNFPVGVSVADKLAFYMEHVGFLSSSEGKVAMIALINQQSI